MLVSRSAVTASASPSAPRRRSRRTALRLHFSEDSTTDTDRPATPARNLMRLSAPLVDKTLLHLSTWASSLTRMLIENDDPYSAYRDMAYFNFLTSIFHILTMLRGSDLEKTKTMFLTGLFLIKTCARLGKKSDVMSNLQSSYASSTPEIVDLWVALMQIIVDHFPGVSPGFELKSPQMRIQFLYLLKPLRRECLELLADDMAVHPLPWLLYLKQMQKIAENDQQTLSGIIPLIEPLLADALLKAETDEEPASSPTENALPSPPLSPNHKDDYCVDRGYTPSETNDDMGPVTPLSFQMLIELPALKFSEAAALSHCILPSDTQYGSHTPLPVEPPEDPAYIHRASSAPDVLYPHHSQNDTTSSQRSLYPPLVSDSGLPSADGRASQKQPTKLLHTVPLPFIEDGERFVANVPIVAPKPMAILPDWWF